MITRCYKACVCVAVWLSLLAIGAIWHLGANSMIACGFLGASFIHVASRPGWKRLGAAVLAGASFGACYFLIREKFGPGLLVETLGIGAFLGLGSLAVMTFDVAWREDRSVTRPLVDALILPIFSFVAGVGMGLFNGHSQGTYDFLLYAYDSALGLTPSHSVTSLFAAHPWLESISFTVYATLLLFPPFYHAWGQFRGDTRGGSLMQAFVTAGVFGFILYQVCPAEGPRYAFGAQFPNQLPAASQLSMEPYASAGVHNAAPSMHMSWALQVWWASWELGPVAMAVATLFAGFTALATIGSGEHYLIDLIVSVPVVMAVEGIFRKRARQSVVGFAQAVAWLLMLRWKVALGWPPAINWGLIALTLTTAGFFQIRPRLAARSASQRVSSEPVAELDAA